VIRVLGNYQPTDDAEDLNIETAIELVEGLIHKSGGES
jgi:hypothetical protein